MFTHTLLCILLTLYSGFNSYFTLGLTHMLLKLYSFFSPCELTLHNGGTHTLVRVYAHITLGFYSHFTEGLLKHYTRLTHTLCFLMLYSGFTHALLQVYLYFVECLLTFYSGCTHNILQVYSHFGFTHTLYWLLLSLCSGFTYTLLQVFSYFTSDLLTLYSRFTHTLLQVYLHFPMGLLTQCFGLPHTLHQFVLTFLWVPSSVLHVFPHLTPAFTDT